MANNLTVTTRLDTHFLKRGRHVSLLPLPSAIAENLGRAVAMWSAIENEINQVIKACLRASDKSEPGWEVLSFKKRRRLCASLIDDVIRPHWPEQAEALIRLVHEAGSAYWKRNLLAHGGFQFSAKDEHQTEVTFEAVGRGKSISLTEEWLTKFWHDLAMIHGDMTIELAKFGHFDGQRLRPLPCTDLISCPEGQNHPFDPTLKSSPVQPQSSEA